MRSRMQGVDGCARFHDLNAHDWNDCGLQVVGAKTYGQDIEARRQTIAGRLDGCERSVVVLQRQPALSGVILIEVPCIARARDGLTGKPGQGNYVDTVGFGWQRPGKVPPGNQQPVLARPTPLARNR